MSSGPWRRRAWAAVRWAAALAALSAGLAELAERVETERPENLASGLWSELSGNRSVGEESALRMARLARERTGLASLGALRVGSGGRLDEGGQAARFNPAAWRVAMGRRSSEALGEFERSWLSAHEVGHAAAFAYGKAQARAEDLEARVGSKAKAEAVAKSMLFMQARGEAFAEIFAFALLAGEGRFGLEAQARAREDAGSGVPISTNIAHDTRKAMAAALGEAEALATARGADLGDLVGKLADNAALEAVDEWGAAPEALCLSGWRGWERWARDQAHMVASNPWRMALGESSTPTRKFFAEQRLGYYAERLRIEGGGALDDEGRLPGWGAALARQEGRLAAGPNRSWLAPAFGALSKAFDDDAWVDCSRSLAAGQSVGRRGAASARTEQAER